MRNISERAARIMLSKVYDKSDVFTRGSGYWGIYGTPTEILILIDFYRVTPSGNYFGDMEYIRNMYRSGLSAPIQFNFHCSYKMFKKLLQGMT